MRCRGKGHHSMLISINKIVPYMREKPYNNRARKLAVRVSLA